MDKLTRTETVRKVRIALIGVGNMGHKYAEMITAGEAEHMVLSAVVIRKSSLMEWGMGLANTDGSHPLIYSTADELFSHSDEYDAVLIATPHKTHLEFAQRAFELGKHVMCDKPAGAVVGDAIAMAKAAEENGKIYGMMFHQRLYPKYIKIKEILLSGELGKISRVMLVSSRYFRTAHYHASGSWRSSWRGEGGGALINQGQHILDIWQWLFGMPQRIYAEIPYGKYNDFSVDDEATITMHYDGGMTAVFMLTTGEAVYEDRLEIIGTKGKILLEDNTLHIYRYSEDSTKYIRKADVNSRENLSVSEEIINIAKTKEPYPEMLENFAEAVINSDSTKLVAAGADAVNPLMLTNAAYYSAWKGESVTLPLDAEEYYAEYIRHMEG
jgi:predicted dehydrogenase